MTTWVMAALIAALVVALGAEYWQHRRALAKIPVRIHVNGTRGKSSVTRLIAAGLRAGGTVTCAKTTGTLARMILPDERELPIFRPAGANIIEQRRIVATAVEVGAQALVIECMAVTPELQAVCEARLIRATHGVITNARPDHLDVMGPTAADVARALCGTTPVAGTLFTAERDHLPILEAAARDRRSELVAVGDAEVGAVAPEELARFRYREHADNVALALAVCERLGVPRDVALAGMQRAAPDPGALTVHRVHFFGRELVFFNAFAANDPVSTRQLWQLACEAAPGVEARIAVLNCRADRPERSVQLGSELATWEPPDHVVLMGSGTYLFAREAARRGFDASRLHFAEGLGIEAIFERILSLVGTSAMLVGMGNIGGQGLELSRFFRNRALPERSFAAPESRP